MQIDEDRIIQAILAEGASALAAESGANLVDAWINACHSEDEKRRVVAVECGFVRWLDSTTAIIGVQDLLTEEQEKSGVCHCGAEMANHSLYDNHSPIDNPHRVIVGNEHKSTKEQTKYWNEDKWFESIATGSQLGIYALALQGGTYYEKKTGKTFTPCVENPKIRVRAASKSNPPAIWKGDGIVSFKAEELEVIKNALLAKAAAIRAMRKMVKVPWQLPGIWCTNQFRRTCDYYEDCLAKRIPEGWTPFDVNDPAYQLSLPYLGERASDPETVVLGASAYAAYSECLEAGRRNTLAGNKEESMALDVGSAMHLGLAEYYRILQEAQNNLTKPLDNQP